MGRLKWASLVFACAAVALAVGAGAFSSVSADRGVEVNVVKDEEAMLGIDTVGDGDTVKSDNPPHEEKLITFENRFGEEIDLSVTIEETPAQHPKVKRPDLSSQMLGPGENATLSAEINCNNGTATSSDDWDIVITATGGTVSIETTETITVECTGNGKKSPNGRGSSDDTGKPDHAGKSDDTGPPNSPPGQSKDK